MEFKHEWKWDWPWEMVNLRDWFYMVNTGFFGNYHLHVRVLGLRSLWTFSLFRKDIYMEILYTRKDKSNDSVVNKYFPKNTKVDTVLSFTPNGPVVSRIPWYFKQPRKDQKTIMHNCQLYKLAWHTPES